MNRQNGTIELKRSNTINKEQEKVTGGNVVTVVTFCIIFGFLWWIFSGGDIKIKHDSPDHIITSLPSVRAEYNNNEMAADLKYNGKIVEIKGIITTKSLTYGTPYITVVLFADKGLKYEVRASCKNQAFISTLRTGDKVMVRGRFSSFGGIIFGKRTLSISKCYVEKIPFNIISNEEKLSKQKQQFMYKRGYLDLVALKQEYGLNEVSAKSRYEGKHVKIIGIIEIIGEGLLDEKPYISINQGDTSFFNLSAHCKCNARQISFFKVGDTVEVGGRYTSRTLGTVYMEHCNLWKVIRR